MALQYNNIAQPLAGFAGGWTASSSNPSNQPGYGAYMANYNQSMAGPVASYQNALINADTQKYGYNTQANMNLTNALNAQQIAYLQNAGQTERTGMQTGSAERIAEGNNLTNRYQSRNTLEGQKYQADIQEAIAQINAKNALAQTDLATGRSLEGLKYGSDAQTEQARIGIQPQMEALAFSRDKWGDLFPFIKDTVGTAMGQYGGNSGGGGQSAPNIPNVGAGYDTQALLNNANQAAYQAYAGQGLDDAASFGARGGTAAGSGNAYSDMQTRRRMGLANQLASNEVNVPLQVAQTMGPLQLQAAGLQETGRAARAQEDLARERIGQSYLATILGLAGSMA